MKLIFSWRWTRHRVPRRMTSSFHNCNVVIFLDLCRTMKRFDARTGFRQMLVCVPELLLMPKTRKTHRFRKEGEFSSESEGIPGKIEEIRIFLDVGVIVFEVGQSQRIFLPQPIFRHDNRIPNMEYKYYIKNLRNSQRTPPPPSPLSPPQPPQLPPPSCVNHTSMLPCWCEVSTVMYMAE